MDPLAAISEPGVPGVPRYSSACTCPLLASLHSTLGISTRAATKSNLYPYNLIARRRQATASLGATDHQHFHVIVRYSLFSLKPSLVQIPFKPSVICCLGFTRFPLLLVQRREVPLLSVLCSRSFDRLLLHRHHHHHHHHHHCYYYYHHHNQHIKQLQHTKHHGCLIIFSHIFAFFYNHIHPLLYFFCSKPRSSSPKSYPF